MEIQMWKEILTPYDLAVEELQIKFNHIVKEYRQAGVYSPIEQVLGRVKSISSIIQKAQRRGIPIDKIQKNILDIAGIRIICQFTEDIYTVVKLIKKRKDMTVISEKDYIKNIKDKYLVPIKITIKFNSGDIVTTKPEGSYDTITYYRYIQKNRDVIWSEDNYVEGYTKTGNTKVQ